MALTWRWQWPVRATAFTLENIVAEGRYDISYLYGDVHQQICSSPLIPLLLEHLVASPQSFSVRDLREGNSTVSLVTGWRRRKAVSRRTVHTCSFFSIFISKKNELYMKCSSEIPVALVLFIL